MKMNKFSNINTFMGMENPYDKSDIVVYGAGFDGTTSNRPGARFASSSMRPEFYGLEILEAIQLTNKFPTPKKVLIDMLEEMRHEQLDLIDKEELNHYIHAKK